MYIYSYFLTICGVDCKLLDSYGVVRLFLDYAVDWNCFSLAIFVESVRAHSVTHLWNDCRSGLFLYQLPAATPAPSRNHNDMDDSTPFLFECAANRAATGSIFCF